jgi:hypothetical protein
MVKYNVELKVFYCIICSREKGRVCPLLVSMKKPQVFLPIEVDDHRDAAGIQKIKTTNVTFEVEARREGEPRFTSSGFGAPPPRAGIGHPSLAPRKRETYMYINSLDDGTFECVTVMNNFISITSIGTTSTWRQKKIQRGLDLGIIKWNKRWDMSLPVLPIRKVIVNDRPWKHSPGYKAKEKYIRFKNMISNASGTPIPLEGLKSIGLWPCNSEPYGDISTVLRSRLSLFDSLRGIKEKRNILFWKLYRRS